MCIRDRKRKVTRRQDSINYISYNTYSEAALPPLCSKEAGFLLSSQAILQVLETAANASLIPRIDHFLAVTLHKYNSGRMKIIHNKVFSTSIADVCALRNLATTPGMFSVSSHGIHWKNLSSISFLKTCDDPDLDLVLHSKVSNDEYFGKTLKFIHSNEDACADIDNDSEESFLVALISTSPWNHQRRNAIRRTWGASRKIDNVNIRVLFVTGVTQKDNQLYNTILVNEMYEFNDIIQANFIESFHNLTLKVSLGLKWMTLYCSHAQYLYKGDDDMFVNFERIVKFLQQRLIPRPFYLGQVMHRTRTIRRPTSKYFIPVNVYSGKYFPPFCSGGGYIISTDVIPAMYRAALKTPLLPIDDAFQGIVAKKTDVSPTMIDQFKNHGGPSDHCALRSSMTVHGFKIADQLMKVWSNYTDTTLTCPEDY
ncbi:beta-1,3-galactosyltransferase 1-like [Anneissia japonica]|uniref:beta-1,3-galactosyltransferase 1-like n=1 Tax=Anneissia japonica TaxID=1529436 RepID=UPI0014257C19|nr:beta-1,3-galactosyltransferase 1-like [Anneissia japonica]